MSSSRELITAGSPLTLEPQVNYSPISYVWIGPPPNANSNRGVPGHDLIGPIEMAKANKRNPLHFWCLNKYVGHYQEAFEHYGIQVHSVEDYLVFTNQA